MEWIWWVTKVKVRKVEGDESEASLFTSPLLRLHNILFFYKWQLRAGYRGTTFRFTSGFKAFPRCQNCHRFQFQDPFVFAPENPLTRWDRKYSSMLHAEVIRFWRRALSGNVEEGTKSRRRKSRRRMWKNRDILELVPSNFAGRRSKTRRPVFHFHAVRGEQIVGLYLE